MHAAIRRTCGRLYPFCRKIASGVPHGGNAPPPALVAAVQSVILPPPEVKRPRFKRPDVRRNGATMQDAVTTIAVTSQSGRADAAGRLRLIGRNVFPFVVVGALWEIVAWAGIFPRRLFQPLEEVALSFVNLTVAGILPHHAIETVIRLLTGFSLAAVIGVTVGVLMGRSRPAED